MNAPIFRRPLATSEPKPALTTAAPAKPPISAWEELVGNPQTHVLRSHAIAPMSPARITHSSTTAVSTTPLPTVRATLTPKPNAATKLKNAAQTTACAGDSTRVDTTVAIELAASWNPLRKSKTRARPTKKMMRVSIEGSGFGVQGSGKRKKPSVVAMVFFLNAERANPEPLSSSVLQHDPLERVADVFAAVDGVLDVVV